MNCSKIKTLVLYADYTDTLSYFNDWLDAFLKSDYFETTALNICSLSKRKLADKKIGEFEFIVLLHSTNGDGIDFIKPFIPVVNRRKGILLSFVGNEVNLPRSPMHDKISLLKAIEPDFIGTQLPINAGKWLYEDCKRSKVIALPHALNTDVFKPVNDIERRPIDIGARSAKYIPHLGDNDRNKLFDFFSDDTFNYPLRIDINTEQRLNRKEWARYLNECKGTVTNEAGSFFLEKDDITVKAVQEYINNKQKQAGVVITNSNHWWKGLCIVVPSGLRKKIKQFFNMKNIREINKDINFDEIYDLFFKDKTPCPFYSKLISSRNFDAIGTKTCQIMFKGKFNGILQADKHYIALEHDFSNIDDVMQRFQDVSFRKKIVDSTYEFILSHHTYSHRISEIKQLL